MHHLILNLTFKVAMVAMVYFPFNHIDLVVNLIYYFNYFNHPNFTTKVIIPNFMVKLKEYHLVIFS